MTDKNALARWQAEADLLPAKDYKPKVPVFVLIGEAYDLAALTQKHWKTRRERKGAIVDRGLDLAGEDKLPAGIGRDLLSLGEALQQAQTAYVLTTGPASRQVLITEAERLVSELQSALEFLFDDGVEDGRDQALAGVVAEHQGDPATPDALASELDDYAALTSQHRKELDGLGGFDASDIDHAVALARQLRELPPDAASSAEQQGVRAAIELRNRIAALLQQKAALVRSAARFVFRDQPDTARKFTSTYERKKRAASRRAAHKKATPTPLPTGGQPLAPGEGPR
jgi:hypothetical protein